MGVVLTYQIALQLSSYNADIYIVDITGMVILREFGPLITAIIAAGRTSTSFTAQIGTMKLNEEIDAITTFGLSPMRVLVLPRVLALMLVMPLLVFIGDVTGILGSMLIADLKLNITGITFIERLRVVLTVKSFFVGLIKAPVFAMFIGIIGCRLGMKVEDNARSVGLNTTATVVESIVAVILLNAGFAILFSQLKI